MATGTEHRKYFVLLSALLLAFCFRVAAQLLVAFFHIPYLPPMDDWYSGLMPYPLLLCCQVAIIILFGKICIDFFRGRGCFVNANRKFGSVLFRFSSIYFVVMVIRYVVRMGLYPHERWIGGSLPIFFHWVLAAFLLTLSIYHLRFGATTSDATPAKQEIVVSWLGGASVFIAIVLWVGWLVAPAALARQLALRPTEFAVRVQSNIPVVMRDKVILRADIFHPEHTERTPTVLLRLPMTKSMMNVLFEQLACRIWAERGYTVVVQGTRGRFGSGGVFYPLRGEDSDGIDTLDWLQHQRWYDGQILTWGGSAFGCTELAISNQTNPGPAALYAYETCINVHRMFYPGGAFALSSALSWAMHSHGAKDQSNWPTGTQILHAADGLPLIDADRRSTGTEIPFFRDWVRHSASADSYWNEIDGINRVAKVAAPVQMMGGWYDPFLPAQLADFRVLQNSPISAVAKKSRLVIGPWTHASEAVLPDGNRKQHFRATTIADGLRWFDENVHGERSTFSPESSAPVKIFVMGKNQWRYENEWPIARAINTPLYLNSDARANGASANGELCFDPPSKDEPSDTYEYDPRDPVPSCGGAVIGTSTGIARQNDVECRVDVLNYTSPVLDKDIEITGPVSAILYCGTSAPCTDFTAKLVDVQPDGSAFNICDGITRCRFNGPSPHQVTVELWPTSIVIFKGHRMRLEISSSNFPHFDRNLNSGNPAATDSSMVVAQQTICHGLHFPSRIILPIIPAKKEAS